MSGLAHGSAMGRVGAFSLPGLDLWFNSSDHRPPHFHAEKPGAWEVRIYFLRARGQMIDVKWNKQRLRPVELRALQEAAEAHRAALLDEWEAKVRVRAPGGDV